jgi:hypothetical protein
LVFDLAAALVINSGFEDIHTDLIGRTDSIA